MIMIMYMLYETCTAYLLTLAHIFITEDSQQVLKEFHIHTGVAQCSVNQSFI